MTFCTNCGEKITAGTKFCSNCGNSISSVENGAVYERKTVYAGEIHKCPNCGEVLNSFVAICPSCGFELSGNRTSSALKEFIQKVEECDRIIANSSKSKSGWDSWSNTKRTWWVILNIFCVCIPLAVYLVLPLITVNSSVELSAEEKRKASLIENFTFPNDRESILAALVYTKDKIDFISKENVDKKSVYWMRLWCAKSEQLKQKADMLFPNDAIVKQNYAEIIDDKTCFDKKVKNKIITGVAVVVSIVLFLTAYYISSDRTEASDKPDSTETFEVSSNDTSAE